MRDQITFILSEFTSSLGWHGMELNVINLFILQGLFNQNMSLKNKADSLADKMNKLTEKLSDNLDISEELQLTGDDIVQYVEEHTEQIDLYSDDRCISEILNLNNMVEDFKYVRDTLKENTDNARRVLNSVTLDLLNSNEDKRAGLIMSFAELNRAVADNMKLYILSYKEISKIILNLDKINKEIKPDQINNTTDSIKNVTPDGEIISTVDLIKKLRQSN